MFFKLEQLYGLNWRYQLQSLPIYYQNTTKRILWVTLGLRTVVNFKQGGSK